MEMKKSTEIIVVQKAVFEKFSRAKAKLFSQFSMYSFIFEDENNYFLKTWNKKCA